MSAAVLELLLADGRTPTGSFACSGGLEAAVAGGLAADGVPGFISARLRTVGRVEAAFSVRASRSSAVGELLDLELEWAARTPAEPLRRASAALGRGLLRTAAGWFPEVAAYRDAAVLCPRPLALGVVARAGGLADASVARLALFDDAATVAAAAVKLLPLDAAVASGWVLDCGALIAEIAEAASVCVELPSVSTPLLDLRAISHATTERRLFAS